MSKKTLIVVSFLVFIAVLVAVVLSMQKKDQKTQQDKTQESQDQNIFSQEESEEIERLKNDPSLVWYEVPEMGIRFRVTPDTKEDLGYFVNTDKEHKGLSSTVFYSYEGMGGVSYEKNCILSEDGWSCGRALLIKTTKEYSEQYRKEYGRNLCVDDLNNLQRENAVLLRGEYADVCFSYTMPDIGPVIDDTFYKERFYKKKTEYKNFGIFLNTIDQFKNGH